MAIEIKGLTKVFEELEVVKDLDMTLPDKGIICLFGTSGCGKTTLLNLLAGVVEPDAGSISGINREKISFVFQENRLLPWATALDNVKLVDKKGDRALEWLDKMGLAQDADRELLQLSGGMKRRVALARALNYGGDVFFMDEPFKGLDLTVKKKVIAIVREEMKNKLAIWVTHDPMEALRLSDLIIAVDGLPLRELRRFSIDDAIRDDLEALRAARAELLSCWIPPEDQ